MSASRAKKVQRRFRRTTLEEQLPDTSWQQWLPHPASDPTSKDNTVHLHDVDRFLSIYNRPVRRRQVTHEATATPPATGVLRNPADGAMYLVGSERNDTLANTLIEGVTTLHLIDGTSFYAEVVRRQRAAGSLDSDPGWLEEVSLGSFYFDLELRTVSEERGSEAVYTSQFFCFTNCSTLQENDYINLADGRKLRVQSPYTDAGFYTARATDTPDLRKDIVFSSNEKNAPDGSNFTFAPSGGGSGTVDRTVTNQNVTAWVGQSLLENATSDITFSDVPVFIDYFAISRKPTTSDYFTVDGEKLAVGQVRSNDTNQQYECICRRT